MGLLLGSGNTKPQYPYDQWYGVQGDITSQDKKLKRVGNLDLHRTLPIQAKLRRFVENEDGSVTNEKMLVNKNTYRLVSFSKETLKEDKIVSSITKNYTGFDVTNIGDMLTLSTEAEVATTEEKTEEAEGSVNEPAEDK